MASGPERVQAALNSRGLEAKVVRLPESTRTAPEAAKAAGCDVGAIAKSLVFLGFANSQGSGPETQPVLVICGGDRRVDTARVAELIGASEVKMAPAEEVRRITGFAIGGVPPLGWASHKDTTPLIIVMDTGLLRWPTIYAAAGAHDALFPINPHRLAEITGARVEDVGVRG